VKFLLLICIDPAMPFDQQPDEIERWVDSVDGLRRDGGPLRPPRTAVTVRVRDGQRALTEGPFAQTTEYVAGFDLIDCESREQAVDLAVAHPAARFGAIEIREIIPD
jgi:hypothetical protein